MTREPRPRRLAADALAGLIGGLIASWAMTGLQALWTRARDRAAPDEDQEANKAIAQTAARAVLGRDLSAHELTVAASAVHCAYGGAMGAAYGALVEREPLARTYAGAAYGVGLWIAGDEIAIPAFGLSGGRSYPLETHLQALASHIVYGVTTELLRRAILSYRPRS